MNKLTSHDYHNLAEAYYIYAGALKDAGWNDFVDNLVKNHPGKAVEAMTISSSKLDKVTKAVKSYGGEVTPDFLSKLSSVDTRQALAHLKQVGTEGFQKEALSNIIKRGSELEASERAEGKSVIYENFSAKVLKVQSDWGWYCWTEFGGCVISIATGSVFGAVAAFVVWSTAGC
ncbi:MAG: hypothetical protein ACYCSP_14895 [Acidobacteriaceae bacterium]